MAIKIRHVPIPRIIETIKVNSSSVFLFRLNKNLHHPLVYFGMNLAFLTSSREILHDYRSSNGYFLRS
ncbi:MAG: hypothetical protein JW969_07455 [Spirochaetales bacterium]|nr:hypothetical protein [Spirochaetales bacterium]